MAQIDVKVLKQSVGAGEVFAVAPYRLQPGREGHGLGVHVLGEWGYKVGVVDVNFPDHASAQAEADLVNQALGLSSRAVEAVISDTKTRFAEKLDEDNGVITLKMTRAQVENVEGNLQVAPCLDPAAMVAIRAALEGSPSEGGAALELTLDNLVHSIVSVIGQTKFDALGGEESLVGVNEVACLRAFLECKTGPEVDLVRHAFVQVSKKGVYPFFETEAPTP